MLDIKEKNVRNLLIEKYLQAETSPDEERLLADYFRDNATTDPDEIAVSLLLLAEDHGSEVSYSPLSAEKEIEFDALMEKANCRTMHKKTKLYVMLSAVAASLVGVMALLLPLWKKRAPESTANFCKITEVTADSVYTEAEIRLALQEDSASGRRQKMLNVCDFYQQAAILFPDCDQVKLEKKGNVILLTASQNDSTHRYYVISTADTSGTTYQMTQLYIGE